MHTVECDRCKKQYEEDLICAFVDGNAAIDSATDNGWTIINNKHYCPDCFKYDETQDEYIVLPSIPNYVFKIKEQLKFVYCLLTSSYSSKAHVDCFETDDDFILSIVVPKEHYPIEYHRSIQKIYKHCVCEEYSNNEFYSTISVKIPKKKLKK